MSDRINEENLCTYNQPGIVDYLKEIALRGKLGVVDMEIACSFIKKDQSVLEIGAGYGRCIDFLLQSPLDLKITALEQSDHMLSLLKTKYDEKLIQIIEGDLLALKITQSFDAILLMWSVFAEFEPQNQGLIITKLLSMLNEDGKIIIDLPNIGEKLYNSVYLDNQDVIVRTPVGNLVNHIPTAEEICMYCKSNEMIRLDKKMYATPAGRLRTMYILYKVII